MLTNYQKDGLELVIDNETGECFASISAVARMCNCETVQIRRHTATILNGDTKALKTLTVKTSKGDRQAKLLDEKLILKCIVKFNPELAASCMEAGLRIFLYGLAGYEVKPVAKTPQTYLEALKALVAVEEEKERLLREQQLLQAEKEDLEKDNIRQAEVIDELFEYSSIIRVAKFNGCHEKAFDWRKLKTASRVLEVEIKQVPCPRFELKNLYHHSVWRFVYPDYRLPETTTLMIKTI